MSTTRGIVVPLLFVLFVSKPDGGQGSASPSSVSRTPTDATHTNQIDKLLSKLKESRTCLSVQQTQNLALRGGELRPSHAKTHSPDIGCGNCILTPGICTACGKSKTTLTPDTLELGSVLGHGSFSTVHMGNSARWGSVAVKKVVVAGEDPTVMKRLCREIHILSRVKHPNVVRLLDVHYEETGTTRSASLLFEACRGGELFDFVNGIDILHSGDRLWQDLRYGMEHTSTEQGLVTEEDLARIIRQILFAVAYLHENKVAHRDLKLENVLLEEPFVSGGTNRVRLIDFGFSKLVEEGEPMFTACGSTLYIAPEVLTAKETGRGYGLECDVWAVGVMSYILLTCNPPFAGATPAETLASIRCGAYTFPAQVGLSADARDFVARLLVADPARRATCREALAHPWITMHAHKGDAVSLGEREGWEGLLWGCVPRALRGVPRRLSTLIGRPATQGV